MCMSTPKPVTPAPPPPPPPVLDQAAPETARASTGSMAKKAAIGNRKYRSSVNSNGNAGTNGLSIN
jgi:hypothetical protein